VLDPLPLLFSGTAACAVPVLHNLILSNPRRQHDSAHSTVTHWRLFCAFTSAFCGTMPRAQLVAGFWFTVAVKLKFTPYPGGSGFTAVQVLPLHDQSAAAPGGVKMSGPLNVIDPAGDALSMIWVPTGQGPEPAL